MTTQDSTMSVREEKEERLVIIERAPKNVR